MGFGKQVKNLLRSKTAPQKTQAFTMKLGCFLMLFFTFQMASFALAAAFPSPQDADKEKAELKKIKTQIEASVKEANRLEKIRNKVKKEIADLRKKIVTSAKNIQRTEEKITHTENTISGLTKQSEALSARLKTRYKQMSKTLAAMQRLSQQPPQLVTIRPGAALSNLRTTELLKKIMPKLQKNAADIRGDVAEINKVKYEISNEQDELKKDVAELMISENEIDILIKKRTAQQQALIKATKKERIKLKTFAARSKNIEDLIAKIEREKISRAKRISEARLAATKKNLPKSKPLSKKSVMRATLPQGTVKFYKAKGKMPFPARGIVKIRFGHVNPQGQRSKGITIGTRSGATVVAPHSGRVMFAGKFRTYGLLLIIDHGDGYHTLLAGMNNISAVVGQQILGGEPIGKMQSSAAAKKATQRLYVEFRRKGKPINPLRWVKKS
jgi:septal ring factor EnvC (AmiA/AmiB activator)